MCRGEARAQTCLGVWGACEDEARKHKQHLCSVVETSPHLSLCNRLLAESDLHTNCSSLWGFFGQSIINPRPRLEVD